MNLKRKFHNYISPAVALVVCNGKLAIKQVHNLQCAVHGDYGTTVSQ